MANQKLDKRWFCSNSDRSLPKNVSAILVSDADTGGGYTCVGAGYTCLGAGYIWEIFILSIKLCCNPTTALVKS